MADLSQHSIETELWREYEFGGIVYRINQPKTLYYRRGGTTHRILTSDGIVHCVPAPGFNGCVLRWKNADATQPINF